MWKEARVPEKESDKDEKMLAIREINGERHTGSGW